MISLIFHSQGVTEDALALQEGGFAQRDELNPAIRPFQPYTIEQAVSDDEPC
ncbi:MAG: hypothetical protein WBS24_01440 [Terriglobales bacterium]